jgi:hypothetical protein
MTTGLNKKQLIAMCKRHNFTGYSKYSIQPMRQYVSKCLRTRAAVIIQRFIRAKMKPLVNDTDVFTLQPFQRPTFKLVVGGIRYQFDSPVLLNYMCSTGKFINPFTNIMITDLELRQLCCHASATEPGEFPDVESILRTRSVIVQQMQEAREQEEIVMFLQEQCLTEFTAMVQFLSQVNDVFDWDDLTVASLHIVNVHVPRLTMAYKMLLQANEEVGQLTFQNALVGIVDHIISIPTTHPARDLWVCVFSLLDSAFQSLCHSIIMGLDVVLIRNSARAISIQYEN